jgi:hypothetical protein
LVLAPAVAVYRSILHQNRQVAKDKTDSSESPDTRTAQLWIIPLLIILFYMQSLLIYVAISGVKFD